MSSAIGSRVRSDRAAARRPLGGCSAVVVERDVPVTMRDGAILRADVWRLATEGRFPTVLQRTPYDKGFSFAAVHHSGIEPLRAVERGFVVVIQDTRGRYRSDGVFSAFTDEGTDGVDTVAWVRSQSFSDGNVFMYGGSYVGAAQLLAAVGRPEGLRGIVPQLTASEYYEGWTHRGGAFELGFSLYWVLTSLAPAELLRRRAAGEEVSELEEALAALVDDPWSAFGTLPLDSLEVVNELIPSYRDWLAHPARDPFWDALAPNGRYPNVDVPALHVAGWFDIFSSGTIENYTRLRREAATEQAREGQYLIVGPWAHGNITEAVGELDFGARAALRALDPTALQLGFFEEVLCGAPDPQRPRVRVLVLGANRWMDLAEWPPPGARRQRLFLSSAGRANGACGDGRLDLEPPGDLPPDTYVYDPTDPVPTIGGASFLPGMLAGLHSGPRDQRPVEERDDVLVYTSPPLERNLLVAGPLRLVLSASSSALDTDWTAKLVDVLPDGRALGISEGILRARYRESAREASLLEPDRPYEFEIQLAPTCIELAAGHRIRLEVSSSSFPRFDRNPNSGVEPSAATASDLAPARQTVFHDSSRRSFLELAVLGAGPAW